MIGRVDPSGGSRADTAKAGRGMHRRIPGGFPNAVFGFGPGRPCQHRSVELEAESFADSCKNAGRIFEQEAGVDHHGEAVVQHGIEQLDLFDETGVGEPTVGKLNRQRLSMSRGSRVRRMFSVR